MELQLARPRNQSPQRRRNKKNATSAKCMLQLCNKMDSIDPITFYVYLDYVM
jgi:hypothetical protein